MHFIIDTCVASTNVEGGGRPGGGRIECLPPPGLPPPSTFVDATCVASTNVEGGGRPGGGRHSILPPPGLPPPSTFVDATQVSMMKCMGTTQSPILGWPLESYANFPACGA